MKKSLPFRLYAGLIICVLLVLFVGFVASNAVKDQNEYANWVTHTNSVLDQIRDTRNGLSQMRSGRRAYWVTEKEEFLDSYLKGFSLVPNYLQKLKDFVADNVVQSKNVAVLEAPINGVLRFWQQHDVLHTKYSLDEYKALVIEEEKMLSLAYKQFEIMLTEEQRLLIEREAIVKQLNNRIQITIAVGIAILLVVVIVLINAVISTLKSRYKAGLKLEENIAEMEKVNKLSNERNWLLEGVSSINDSSRTAETGSVEDLSQSILNALVKYLEIPAGVFFLANEEQTKLITSATVAVSGSAKKEFDFGEGIVGNTARNKTVSLIKEVPAGYWRVESAMGNTSGKGEIICVPLLINKDLKGVIELGSFHAFTNLQKELLDNVTRSIAISINARQSRKKNEKLLAQVQEQKEEMESQQEELRQTNEELSRQAEELQASEEELKTQEEELRQINIELNDKNAAVENARQAIILKAKELEETSKFKSEFLANMSHELRTPLNSVLILAKLLADNKPENLTPKQIEYANIIHKSGADLLQLINDILDLSKIEAGKVELNIEEIGLKEIAMDMQQLFTVVSAEKNIQFETTFASDIPSSIKTDKQRVEQVLKNLLSNAFKFTPKNGHVHLSFTNRELFNKKALAISVTDSGIGISPSKQQLIFEAFQQADGSTNRKYGGTGLGLSISKELMRLLAGEIELQSEEGKGSTFTIVLPLENSYVKKPDEQISLDEQSNDIVLSLENVEEQTTVADDKKAVKLSDNTILIIEDDPHFATIVKDFAHSKGYKAIVALQGDEGLKYAKQFRPSAIILDIQLPVIDGWTLLKILKEDNDLKHIPVHIISAYDDGRLNFSGAMAYIKKPVDRQALETAFSSIETFISQHVKKVLLLSDTQFTDDALQNLFKEKHPDAKFYNQPFVGLNTHTLELEKFDCVIADIGEDVKKGLEQLALLQGHVKAANIPLIICVSTDISFEDEMQLKKISNTIVRKSVASNNRLMDEMELFLYKVQQSSQSYNRLLETNHGADKSLANKKILLVDDDMRNVFALSAALELQDMEVVSAVDGKDALDKLKQHTDFDLVLMDIMMPEMDGYEAMQKIRKDLKLVHIPIIALTAKAMVGDREKCIEAGASDYITKPIDMQKLFSLMHVWLAN
jgi:signal transduction histidine kinase/CheY-like chemotaxis protein/CHASE3 domain sensor protein